MLEKSQVRMKTAGRVSNRCGSDSAQNIIIAAGTPAEQQLATAGTPITLQLLLCWCPVDSCMAVLACDMLLFHVLLSRLQVQQMRWQRQDHVHDVQGARLQGRLLRGVMGSVLAGPPATGSMAHAAAGVRLHSRMRQM